VWCKVPLAIPKVFLNSAADRLDLFGRLVWDGCHLSPSIKVSCDSEEPCAIDAATIIAIHSQPKAEEMESLGFSDNGAYSMLKEMMVAVLKEVCNIPRGILMSGPPGVGKTYLVQCLCREYKVPLVVVNGPEMVSPLLGQSEANLRTVFENAATHKCCVLFLDEIVNSP
jgi:DNA replication protein DnaC